MSSYNRRGGGFGGAARSGGDYRGGGSNFEDKCTEEMYVQARDCGKIIGRGGVKIRDLQFESGCQIKVNRDDESDGTRRVDLSGSDDAIARAKHLIQSTLEEDDRGPRQSYQQRSYGGGGMGGGGMGGGGGSDRDVIRVDSNFVGRIIGRQGSRIREIQDESGCRVNVSRDGDDNGQTEVELRGSRHQIQKAKDIIDEIVNQSQGY